MNYLKILASAAMALMLANSATGAWAQTAQPIIGSTAGAIQSDDAIDQELAEQISHAWLAGKDVSGAVAFQVKGENALTQGNPQQARRYFEAAQHELKALRPSPVGAPYSSGY